MERASPFGMGWFISNHKTIERLGIDKHPRVYLYQKFPAGIWPNCEVEIGVVHWDECSVRPDRQEVQYQTLDLAEHANVMARIKAHYRKHDISRPEADVNAIKDAFYNIQRIIREEKAKRPSYNVWLDKNGILRIYLSTRFKTKRKLSREEILRVCKVDNQHPLTFTTDREGRKLLAELVECGFYTIQPEARAAIRHPLGEVSRLACPLLPVTDFECVAYAEDEDRLFCVADFHNQAGERLFTKGKHYELSTNSYAFTEHFNREKPHYNEETGQMYTATHKCQLSGTDRYIAIQDDQGKLHRFMERPQSEPYDHDESALWRIFERPVVKTVAESHPEAVRKNALILSTCELLADFAYYPGQLDYLSRLGVKDYGVVAADTGCGKSLMALSLIQMKAPNRALVIAPQGTMRSSSRDEDDDEDQTDYQASQWLEELRRYAPGLAVFQLFSMDDYHRILTANHGQLPSGVYITYYQAIFSNGARETAAASWDDKRLETEIQLLTGDPQFTLGEADKASLDPNRHWCRQVGEERNGIRCILTPCMATEIGHHFDFVALDEGHLCCNLGATVSQMLIRLQPRYRYVLSATPITNVVSNLFPLMGWVCVKDWYKGGQRNAAWPYARDEIARFTETFQSVERDFTQEQMNDAENKKNKNRFKSGKCIRISPIISAPARLLKILKPNMAYISKPMVRPDYQGPKILDVRVPMGKQQTELYVHFMNRGNITNPDGRPCNALIRARKQITYLRNICADPAGFDHGGPIVRSNFNPKTVAILELARDIIARGDPFVIVCARKGQTDTLHRALKEAGVLLSRIDSTVIAEQHSHQSNLFKAHKTQGLLLGMKCANSYSFSECPYMIIGSLEYSWGSLAQARGRVDRVNSKRPATIYCVLHKHSLEEVIFDVVGTKSDAASICLQGRRVPRNFKPLDLSEVLAMSITGFKSESVDESLCEAQWPKLRQSIADALGATISCQNYRINLIPPLCTARFNTMKTQIRPSTGIITVVINTPQGRRTVSTGCTDPVEARQVIKSANIAGIEVLAKANAPSQALIQKLVVGANLTVEQAIGVWEEWLRCVSGSDRTAENHVMFVRAWARDTRTLDRKISTIKEPDITRWINQVDGTKLASKRVKLAAVRSLFNFCSVRRYTNGDPSREVRVKARLLCHEQKEPRRKTCFTDQEVNRIVEYLNLQMLNLMKKPQTPATVHKLNTARFWYCAVLIGRYAGLRLGDICALEWACLKQPGKLVVWTDKRDTRVDLPVNDDLARGLAAIPANGHKVCFPEQDAVSRSAKRCKLSVQFSRILRAVGIQGHSFHDLRHTFCSDCQRKGIPTPHIARLVGHSNERTTTAYLH